MVAVATYNINKAVSMNRIAWGVSSLLHKAKTCTSRVKLYFKIRSRGTAKFVAVLGTLGLSALLLDSCSSGPGVIKPPGPPTRQFIASVASRTLHERGSDLQVKFSGGSTIVGADDTASGAVNFNLTDSSLQAGRLGEFMAFTGPGVLVANSATGPLPSSGGASTHKSGSTSFGQSPQGSPYRWIKYVIPAGAATPNSTYLSYMAYNPMFVIGSIFGATGRIKEVGSFPVGNVATYEYSFNTDLYLAVASTLSGRLSGSGASDILPATTRRILSMESTYFGASSHLFTDRVWISKSGILEKAEIIMPASVTAPPIGYAGATNVTVTLSNFGNRSITLPPSQEVLVES